MKPERVDLRGVREPRDLINRVVQTRLREAQRLAAALESRDKAELHDFRIACKRLRYTLERFESLEPWLQPAAERLALVQDALGEAHDRDVLLTILPPAMGQTQRRLLLDRDACVDRATKLWKELRSFIERIASHQF
jgi:CHAD domain-containing protein